jgi:subtilase-type serine protease
MNTRNSLALIVSVVLSMSGIVSAQWLWWTNDATNRSWVDTGNWTAYPTSGDDVVIGRDSANGPIIQNGMTGYGNWVHLTDTTPGGAVLTVNGGTLNVADHFLVGENWGADHKGTLDLIDGTVNTTLLMVGGGTDGSNGNGTVDISGGVINIGWMLAIAGGYSGTNGNGTGKVNLTGGTINATGGGGLVMAPKGALDIAGGALVLAGNISNIASYGNVTAYNGVGTFVYSYNSGSNLTTITAIPEPATLVLLGLGGLLLRKIKA